MTVEQVYNLVNTATSEVLGESAVVAEDLSNVVDIGTALFNANAVDNFVNALVNRIGKTIFVNRAYAGRAPRVLRDSWEFGSCLQKISAEMPMATENESWELTDGTSYDPNVFHRATVTAKYFNKRVTFEIDLSFTERQVKESFISAAALNAFLSMLYNEVEKSLTVKIDALIMRTINDMIGETIYADYQGGTLSASSGVKAVNLYYLFAQANPGTSLTAADCATDPDFIRFAVYIMGLYKDRMGTISSLFNVENKARFTPADLLHVVLLSEFAAAAGVYLQSDTYHDEFVRLPDAETVPYWQGSGTTYAYADPSSINLTTASNHAVNVPYILGVMFDRDAVAVCNLNRRVTANYNAKAEFYNNFYKFDCAALGATDEQCVVFFCA